MFARGLGTLGTFEGSVAGLLARKLRRISKELTATNQSGIDGSPFGRKDADPDIPDLRQAKSEYGRLQ